MTVFKLLGGKSPGHDINHQKAAKGQAVAEYNQRKVEIVSDCQCKASSSMPEIKSRMEGVVDEVSGLLLNSTELKQAREMSAIHQPRL